MSPFASLNILPRDRQLKGFQDKILSRSFFCSLLETSLEEEKRNTALRFHFTL